MLNLSSLCVAEEEEEKNQVSSQRRLNRNEPQQSNGWWQYKVSPVAPSNSRILSRLFRVYFLF